MTKAIVVAYDTNKGIGSNGDLPWGRALPADLANFKKLTTGGTIVMGRKTFESIGSKALPNRENIVVSSRPTGVKGILTALSLSSAYALARYPIFIIGGGQIYRAALEDADVIYATEVKSSFPDVDTYFPALSADWAEVSRTSHPADDKNQYAFDFVEFRRQTS